MDINELRQQIDSVDTRLAELFEQRMKTATAIAKYKKENGLSVFDSEREREVLCRAVQATAPEIQPYTQALYQKIFELSRTYQEKLISPEDENK